MKPLLLTLLLCVATFPGNAQEIDLENKLVARYLFNGNARTEVEDNNHTIPHSDDLNWDARSESYSIAFWIKSPGLWICLEATWAGRRSRR